jgi:hypothetical protein
MEGVLMSRRPARFTQGDVARAIRAAKAAGAPSLQIKPDGTIIVDLLKSTAVQETEGCGQDVDARAMVRAASKD